MRWRSDGVSVGEGDRIVETEGRKSVDDRWPTLPYLSSDKVTILDTGASPLSEVPVVEHSSDSWMDTVFNRSILYSYRILSTVIIISSLQESIHSISNISVYRECRDNNDFRPLCHLQLSQIIFSLFVIRSTIPPEERRAKRGEMKKEALDLWMKYIPYSFFIPLLISSPIARRCATALFSGTFYTFCICSTSAFCIPSSIRVIRVTNDERDSPEIKISPEISVSRPHFDIRMVREAQ